MLSRTADGLFWLARYMERAENVARILTAGQRMREPHAHGRQREQRVDVDAGRGGCSAGYLKKHTEITPEGVVDFLVRDPDNPSSVLSASSRAPQRAHRAHGAHADMWEALNDTWLELRSLEAAEGSREALSRLLEWVKHRSLLFDGARQHHAAQRRLLLHAARHLSRARRQHRAHPRREVPRAAAARRERRRPARLLPVGDRSCARSPRCAPTTGCITRSSRRG